MVGFISTLVGLDWSYSVGTSISLLSLRCTKSGWRMFETGPANGNTGTMRALMIHLLLVRLWTRRLSGAWRSVAMKKDCRFVRRFLCWRGWFTEAITSFCFLWQTVLDVFSDQRFRVWGKVSAVWSPDTHFRATGSVCWLTERQHVRHSAVSGFPGLCCYIFVVGHSRTMSCSVRPGTGCFLLLFQFCVFWRL